MRRFSSWIVLACVLTSCGATPAVTSTTPAPQSTTNVVVAPTAEIVPTSPPEPTNTPLSTATSAPTVTVAPSQTSTAAPIADVTQIFALNNLASQESGGIKLDIARVLVSTPDALKAIGTDLTTSKNFEGAQTIMLIIFRATNTSDKTIGVYPDQGTIVVGSEQVELTTFMFSSSVGKVGGEIFAGVTRVGGVYFPIKRSSVEQVTKMIVAVNAPVDEKFASLGEKFNMTLDLSNHEFQAIPDDLK